MEYGERIHQLAYGNFRAEPASARQLRALNMLLGHATTGRTVRLYLLQWVFNRPFNSSKELSKSEARALIEVGYDSQWQPVPEFLSYLSGAFEVEF